MLGVEALNLLNARPGILGEIEDIDLTVRENVPHTDGCVRPPKTQWLDLKSRRPYQCITGMSEISRKANCLSHQLPIWTNIAPFQQTNAGFR